MVCLRFLSFIWYLIRSIMFWGAIFFVFVPRGKGESYFFDKYFFAQNDMNRINIWFGLLLDRINYGTFEVFSGHLVLNSIHNISNRGNNKIPLSSPPARYADHTSLPQYYTYVQ